MTDQVRALLKMEHHVSKRHPQMPNAERAAQFAPFSALTGFEERISRAEEIPEADWVPDEEVLAALNDAILRLEALPRHRRGADITCVHRDEDNRVRYIHMSGIVRSLDTAGRTLTLEHGVTVGFDEICAIRLQEEGL